MAERALYGRQFKGNQNLRLISFQKPQERFLAFDRWQIQRTGRRTQRGQTFDQAKLLQQRMKLPQHLDLVARRYTALA